MLKATKEFLKELEKKIQTKQVVVSDCHKLPDNMLYLEDKESGFKIEIPNEASEECGVGRKYRQRGGKSYCSSCKKSFDECYEKEKIENKVKGYILGRWYTNKTTDGEEWFCQDCYEKIENDSNYHYVKSEDEWCKYSKENG